MPATIRVKRAYEEAEASDGERFLVDRVWPRGRSRAALALEDWAREAAPSDELRRWFGHDPARWEEFRRRYDEELEQRPEAWEPLVEAARRGAITLVYGARDTDHNNAVALRSFLSERLDPSGQG